MFLSPTDVECMEECEPGVLGCPKGGTRSTCPENNIFYGQTALQNFLVITAIVCIPVMLFAKPLALRARYIKAH